MILILPNLLHGAYQSHKMKCVFTSIVFHPDFIESSTMDTIQKEYINPFMDNTFVSSYVLEMTDRNNEFVQYLLEEFTNIYAGKQRYKELLLKGYLYQILFHLLMEEEKYTRKTLTDYVNEERKKRF